MTLMSNASLEKMTIGILLIIAWGWIMVTIGMVFYHGYYPPINHTSGTTIADLESDGDRHHHLPGFGLGGGAGGGMNDDAQEDDKLQQQRLLGNGVSPLLLFTYRRADYLKQTLEDVLRYIPHDCQSVGCPIVISQDGNIQEVTNVIREYQIKFQSVGIPLVHWQHEQPTDLELRGSLARVAHAKAYAALAQHYKWALDKVFLQKHPFANDDVDAAIVATASPQRVIVLEEDLHIAPDFFSYFAALAHLLDHDDTLLAVSAYNDNGLQGLVSNVTRLLRSDFFPGLGWMMTQQLWAQELSSTWPMAFWDDWLREPPQRKGRHIIRPEVSRTFHFGSQGGTSNNQFGKSLQNILLNPTPVQWQEQDLSYLQEEAFDRQYWQLLQSAQLVDSLEQLQQQQQQSPPLENGKPVASWRLEYRNIKSDFPRVARKLGLFTDEKAGIPRTAYKGIVETHLHVDHLAVEGDKQRQQPWVFLTPPMDELKKSFSENSGSSNTGNV